jgi:hypothetical protein
MQSDSYRKLASTLARAIRDRTQHGLPPINTCIVMGTGTLCGHSSSDVRNINQADLRSEITRQNVALYQIAVFCSVIKLLGEICRMMLLWGVRC